MSNLYHTLLADLGKSYNPQRALDFLHLLQNEAEARPEVVKAQGNLEQLLEKPPKEDQVLQVIYETPFVRGEIVLAGKKSRQENPLLGFYPVHFKKTYRQKLSRWESSPTHERTMSKMVWDHFQEHTSDPTAPRVPMPLDADGSTFRSELIEGKSLGSMSPIHNSNEAKEIVEQIQSARKNYGPVGHLWAGLESLRETSEILHMGGMLHNDLHRENLLLAERDGHFDGCIIDFETLEEDDRFGTPAWQAACRNDNRFLIEEAALIRLCASPKEKLPTQTPLAIEATWALKTFPKLTVVVNMLNQIEKNRPSPQMS